MTKDLQELINIIRNEVFTEEEKVEQIQDILSENPELANAKDRSGRTILHYAIEYQNLPIIQHLLRKVKVDPDIDDYNDTPLTLAIGLNNIEIVRELLIAGANPHKDICSNLTPLFRAIKAIRRNSLAIVKLLVKNGANPNMSADPDRTPLIEAVLMNHKKVAKFLLHNLKNRNNNPSYIYKSHLKTGLKHYPEILEFFTEKGVEIEEIDNYISKNPDIFDNFVQEYVKNYLNILEFLLQNGAEVDSTDPECGCTALHQAAGGGNLGAVKLLVKYGADINATTPEGFTPLRLSIKNGHNVEHPETAKFLIQHRLAQDQKADKPDYLYGQYSAYWDECHDEIEEMQKHKIGDSEISFFDILVADKKKLASYVNNYDAVKVLDPYDCEEKFPIYADKIKNQYTKGMNIKVAADIILNFSIALNEYTSHIIFNLLDYDYKTIRSLCVAGYQELIKKRHTNTEAATERSMEDADTVSGCFSCIRVKEHRKCVIL